MTTQSTQSTKSTAFQRLIAMAVLPLLLLTATACSSEQTTAYLEASIAAAIAVAPAIEASSNVSPATQATVTAYLSLANDCLTNATNVLNTAASSGITAAEGASIAADCSATLTATQILPAGTPTNVVNAVNAVSLALAAFLKSLPAQSAVLLQLSHPEFVNGFAGPAASKRTVIKLNRKKLASANQKLLLLHGSLTRLSTAGPRPTTVPAAGTHNK